MIDTIDVQMPGMNKGWRVGCAKKGSKEDHVPMSTPLPNNFHQTQNYIKTRVARPIKYGDTSFVPRNMDKQLFSRLSWLPPP